MITSRKQPARTRRHNGRRSRPRLPLPLPLRPPDLSHPFHRQHADQASDTGRTVAPRQYRLELIAGITGTELDILVSCGFVDHAVFERCATGVWLQTTLESDASPATAAGDL